MGRIKNIKVRLTEEEYKRLNEQQQKNRFSDFSSYLRFLIFSKKIHIEFSPSVDELSRVGAERNKKLGELNRQIVKIGININQIAKKVNSQQYVMREDMSKLLKEMEALHTFVNSIK